MSNLICAIQLGSSRIMAIAAKKDLSKGTLSDIQIESEPARDCISHGCIVNVERTAMHISSIIKKLGNRMHATISSAYVGVGGMSMHSLNPDTSVSVPDYDVLSREETPSGDVQLIIAQKRVREGVLSAMKRANVQVLDVFALPRATALILSREERQQGCILVDMGAGTTTVSVYKDNLLKHLAVIPLGGNSVTYDLQSVCSNYEEAERIKLEWSNVTHEVSGDAPVNNAGNSFFADSNLPVSINQLNHIALCRYEEIAANILHQVEMAGLKEMPSLCILTGGASVQRGLTTLLSRRLNIARIETRACHQRAMLGSERKPHLTNVLALLEFCTEDCQAIAKPAEPVVVKPKPEAPVVNEPAGQLNLDLKTEPETPEESGSELSMKKIKKGFLRFAKDLISGQD